MSQQTVTLTQQEKQTLNYYLQSDRYPDAYRFARDVVSAKGGDERTINWLNKAADINEGNQYSVWSNLVRSSTIEAAHDQGMTLTNQQFQFASNSLAKGVISGFVNSGAIPHIESIIRQDVSSVVKQLGLTPEGWAGTATATWSIDSLIPGLGLDGADKNGEFQKYLFNDWKQRGVDDYFEKTIIYIQSAENNLAGIKDASGAKLNQLANWTWSKVTGYVDKQTSTSQNNIEDFKFFLKTDLEKQLQQSITDKAFGEIISNDQYYKLETKSNIVGKITGVVNNNSKNPIDKLSLSLDSNNNIKSLQVNETSYATINKSAFQNSLSSIFKTSLETNFNFKTFSQSNNYLDNSRSFNFNSQDFILTNPMDKISFSNSGFGGFNFNTDSGKINSLSSSSTAYKAWDEFKFDDYKLDVKTNLKLDFSINKNIYNSLNNFGNATNHASPLAFDLDGDGIETTHAYETNIYFDIDNDNFAERVGWIAKDDGQLALDKNLNGEIDNVTELFGDYRMSAWDELRLLDSNKDNLINNQDSQFNEAKFLVR